jgi:hypothetical protein
MVGSVDSAAVRAFPADRGAGRASRRQRTDWTGASVSETAILACHETPSITPASGAEQRKSYIVPRPAGSTVSEPRGAAPRATREGGASTAPRGKREAP